MNIRINNVLVLLIALGSTQLLNSAAAPAKPRLHEIDPRTYEHCMKVMLRLPAAKKLIELFSSYDVKRETEPFVAALSNHEMLLKDIVKVLDECDPAKITTIAEFDAARPEKRKIMEALLKDEDQVMYVAGMHCFNKYFNQKRMRTFPGA